MPERTIAVGDVHGCSRALHALIAAIQPTVDDVVVTLGDYVNRGPDSRGVLDALAELRGRCRLVPLLGNHDEMLLRAHAGLPAAATNAGGNGRPARPDRDWGRELPRLSSANLAFLKACVGFHETDRHLFVHASYDPSQPLDRQPASILRWHSLRDGVPRRHESGKTAVVGHTSQKNGKILDLGHIVCIDTYCHGGGWLTALDVDSGQVWQADRDGRVRRSSR
ncbi:metallophosphoesterase family protein [Planctomyces sp. SH-PL62]|uniref:metallophosphoesterase family protein n=1 Tax=Planctomyces sp. SH-PL62 TaxID=1636152 RepID=UPI00078C8386|nr:metallophosphoesterase family protein [Planctomyces sp. SH-PL62]AMV38927.1 diadenosine tetraphosphatase [Planctomyces sp. SH-PL62]